MRMKKLIMEFIMSWGDEVEEVENEDIEVDYEIYYEVGLKMRKRNTTAMRKIMKITDERVDFDYNFILDVTFDSRVGGEILYSKYSGVF